jgi:hypothetical protein
MSDTPLKPNDKLMAKIAVSEARQGYYQPLIARVMLGRPLTQEEREIIRDALDKLEGKRGKAALRQVENSLIASRLEDLANELGSMEAAVAAEAKQTGRKRSTIFAAVRESKKRRGRLSVPPDFESKKRK